MQRIVGMVLSLGVFMAAWGAGMSGQVAPLASLTRPQEKVVTIVRAPQPASAPLHLSDRGFRPRSCRCTW